MWLISGLNLPSVLCQPLDVSMSSLYQIALCYQNSFPSTTVIISWSLNLLFGKLNGERCLVLQRFPKILDFFPSLFWTPSIGLLKHWLNRFTWSSNWPSNSVPNLLLLCQLLPQPQLWKMLTREHRTILAVWPIFLGPRHMDLYLALNEKSTSRASQEPIFTRDYSFSLNQFHSSANLITVLCLLPVKYLINTGPKRDSSRSPDCHPNFNSWRCPHSPLAVTCKLEPMSLIFSMNFCIQF